MPYDGAARIADFAKDAYAGQFFYGLEPSKPQISIACKRPLSGDDFGSNPAGNS